jgi:hypothetical protein
MATQPGNPVPYEVSMVDMPTPGIYAPFATSTFRGQLAGYRGGITSGAGGTAGGAVGAGGTPGSAPSGNTTVNVVQPGAGDAGGDGSN